MEVHEIVPEENIKIQAWFDIVNWEDKRGTKFYPLFNVYNYTKSTAQVLIGMQLLDKDKAVLTEISGSKSFEPTKKTEPSYETYISLNAKSLTEDVIKNTRFLNVLYAK